MADYSTVNAALKYVAEAQLHFELGAFSAARAAIGKLDALNFSFLDVTAPPNYEPRRVTVCIVAHRESEDAAKLLESIQTLSLDSEFEFCLVSNAETDIFINCPLPEAIRKIQTGANFGASLGRNAAIHFCQSEYIIFIDDDGYTSPACVKSLFETAQTHDATAVRGRVIPKSGFLSIPVHYDRGDILKPHYINIEGMTLWRMDALKRCSFDPLLYGHEGVDLTSRLYPYYGPNAFLYDPRAILLHDYGNTEAKALEKVARMQRNDVYLETVNPSLKDILSTFRNYWDSELSAHSLAVRRSIAALPVARRSETEVTVITTCHNGANFIRQYADTWTSQTDRGFRIVFVDDGSDDGSRELARQAFEGFDNFSLIESEHVGRGAALNLAVMHAETDICLIADVDDISAPQRVDWTRRVYESNPALQVVGFGVFTQQAAVREQTPHGVFPTALRSRALLGMPMPFPAISFRRSAMREPFNPELLGGIDCDWLLRNITAHPVEGCFLPTSMVHYAVHDGQISATKRRFQDQVKLSKTRAYHQLILGSDRASEEADIAWFTGLEQVPVAQFDRLNNYASELARKTLEHSPHSAVDSVMQIYRTVRRRTEDGPDGKSAWPGPLEKYRELAVAAAFLYALGLTIVAIMLLE